MTNRCRRCSCNCPTAPLAHPSHDDVSDDDREYTHDGGDTPSAPSPRMAALILVIAALVIVGSLLFAGAAHAAELDCDPAVMSCTDETPPLIAPLGLHLVTVAPTSTATCAEAAKWRRQYEGARANQVETEKQLDLRTAERGDLARKVTERDARILHLAQRLVQAPPPAPVMDHGPEIVRAILLVGGSIAGASAGAGVCVEQGCMTIPTVGVALGGGLVGAGLAAVIAALVE